MQVATFFRESSTTPSAASTTTTSSTSRLTGTTIMEPTIPISASSQLSANEAVDPLQLEGVCEEAEEEADEGKITEEEVEEEEESEYVSEEKKPEADEKEKDEDMAPNENQQQIEPPITTEKVDEGNETQKELVQEPTDNVMEEKQQPVENSSHDEINEDDETTQSSIQQPEQKPDDEFELSSTDSLPTTHTPTTATTNTNDTQHSISSSTNSPHPAKVVNIDENTIMDAHTLQQQQKQEKLLQQQQHRIQQMEENRPVDSIKFDLRQAIVEKSAADDNEDNRLIGENHTHLHQPEDDDDDDDDIDEQDEDEDDHNISTSQSHSSSSVASSRTITTVSSDTTTDTFTNVTEPSPRHGQLVLNNLRHNHQNHHSQSQSLSHGHNHMEVSQDIEEDEDQYVLNDENMTDDELQQNPHYHHLNHHNHHHHQLEEMAPVDGKSLVENDSMIQDVDEANQHYNAEQQQPLQPQQDCFNDQPSHLQPLDRIMDELQHQQHYNDQHYIQQPQHHSYFPTTDSEQQHLQQHMSEHQQLMEGIDEQHHHQHQQLHQPHHQEMMPPHLRHLDQNLIHQMHQYQHYGHHQQPIQQPQHYQQNLPPPPAHIHHLQHMQQQHPKHHDCIEDLMMSDQQQHHQGHLQQHHQQQQQDDRYKLISPASAKQENLDDGYETSATGREILTPNSLASSTHSTMHPMTPTHHGHNIQQPTTAPSSANSTPSMIPPNKCEDPNAPSTVPSGSAEGVNDPYNFIDEDIKNNLSHMMSPPGTPGHHHWYSQQQQPPHTHPQHPPPSTLQPIHMQQSPGGMMIGPGEQIDDLHMGRVGGSSSGLLPDGVEDYCGDLGTPKKRGRKKKDIADMMSTSVLKQVVTKERKKHDRFNGMPEEEVCKRTLPDHLADNLDIVIIGINPGLFAAYKGHHYAGPGNHFWKCLYLSGLTNEQMIAEEDYQLIDVGIGFTNMVERATKGSADLTRKEIKDGSKILLEKLQRYRPKIAVFNGKLIFEVFSGKKDFNFGKQPECIEGTNTHMWVMPSSSARCAQLPRAADKVPFYAALKKFRDYLLGLIPHKIDESEFVFSDPKFKQICDLESKTPTPTSSTMAGIENLYSNSNTHDAMSDMSGCSSPNSNTNPTNINNNLIQNKQMSLHDPVVAPTSTGGPLTPNMYSSMMMMGGGGQTPSGYASPLCLDTSMPEKKKRGRPKKIKGVDGMDIDGPTPNKLRNVNNNIMTSQMVAQAAAAAMMNENDPNKKKRGRPKKNKLLVGGGVNGGGGLSIGGGALGNSDSNMLNTSSNSSGGSGGGGNNQNPQEPSHLMGNVAPQQRLFSSPMQSPSPHWASTTPPIQNTAYHHFQQQPPPPHHPPPHQQMTHYSTGYPSPYPGVGSAPHTDLSSEISAAINSADNLVDPPLNESPDHNQSASPNQQNQLNYQADDAFMHSPVNRVTTPTTPQPQQKKQISDVTTKSLSGLESLVDQIPTVSENAAANAAAAAAAAASLVDNRLNIEDQYESPSKSQSTPQISSLYPTYSQLNTVGSGISPSSSPTGTSTATSGVLSSNFSVSSLTSSNYQSSASAAAAAAAAAYHHSNLMHPMQMYHHHSGLDPHIPPMYQPHHPHHHPYSQHTTGHYPGYPHPNQQPTLHMPSPNYPYGYGNSPGPSTPSPYPGPGPTHGHQPPPPPTAAGGYPLHHSSVFDRIKPDIGGFGGF